MSWRLLRAEFLKQRSTRTNLELLGAMVGLIALIVYVHGVQLPVERLATRTAQLIVLGQGRMIGTLFGAILGGLSITGEFRHGTIRPTFVVTPKRGRVLLVKVVVGALFGVAFGLIAAAAAVGVGGAALAQRGVVLSLDGNDYALLLAGTAAGAGLWAAIGTGLGAVVRNQVPLLIGICIWLLFVESLLFEDLGLKKIAGISDIGRFLPGTLAKEAAGLGDQTLLAPGAAVLGLAVYAVAAAAIGWMAIRARDVP